MTDEPNWTQTDPTAEQVKAWLTQHAGEFDSALLLARAANEHFARPFHINVLQDMARTAYQQHEAKDEDE